MKRGESGLSLLVAVNKPTGMTSHDVVNRCRRIFGERRVGHTGTLDPLATGVLPVCVGPATRLGTFLTAHDKRYRTTIGFGFETETDDIQGAPTVFGEVPPDLLEGDFAESYVAGLTGPRMQVPPRYSAIKQNGKKAYELARAGKDIALDPRPVEVYESRLVSRYETPDGVRWEVDFSVSKGTYIRALVRDMGRELGCYAHVVALERRRSGTIDLEECVTLETLEARGAEAALDPVRALGYRIVFADDRAREVENGARLKAGQVQTFELDSRSASLAYCACMGSTIASPDPLADGERVSVVIANRLKGIYAHDAATGLLKSECIFSTGVFRG